MKIFFAVATFLSFFCASFGSVLYDTGVSESLQIDFNLTPPPTKDIFMIVNFLKNYIIYRSSVNGWETQMEPKGDGLFYVCSVSLAQKQYVGTAEYFVVKGQELKRDDKTPYRSVEGNIYCDNETKYDPKIHAAALQCCLNKLATQFENAKIKLGLPHTRTQGDVQAAVAIVQKYKLNGGIKIEVEDFLLLAVSVECSTK